MAVIYALLRVRLNNVQNVFVHQKSNHRRNRHYFSANGPFLLLPLALKWGLFLFGFVFILPCLCCEGAFAASLTLTVPGNLTVTVTPTAEGNFTESATSNISVKATADFGYTLTVQSKDGKTNALTNSAANAKIESISSPLTAQQGKTSAWKVNTWGYKANGNYQPGPTSNSVIANVATAQSGVTTNYPFQIAAKVDNTLPAGTYSNTFIFAATANAAKYSVTYNNCEGANCPDNIVSQSSTEKSITIDKKTPTKNSYNFLGWCSAEPTTSKFYIDSCPEGNKSYKEGGTYELASSNDNVQLYAMWQKQLTFEEAYALSGKTQEGEYYKMQDMTAEICDLVTVPSANSTATLIDIRDKNIYTVAKLLDGKCWMTQNLAIGSNEKEMTINSTNSDMNNGSFLLPKGDTKAATSVGDTSGWHINQYDISHIYIDKVYGGYYNWFAATAGEGTESKISGDTSKSICPKNWKLPTKDNMNSIMTKYGTNLKDSPANFIMGGTCNQNGCPTGRNTTGYWWTSTAYDNGSAWDMTLDNTGERVYIDTTGELGNVKGGGDSIRCIAR